MSNQTTSRASKRSSALVVSALAAVGSLVSPSASIFADAPPRKPEIAASSTPSAPQVIVETIETQDLVGPNFNAEHALRISTEDAQKFEALVDLYVYAYPLVLANEIKRETTSRFFLSTANETFYFPRLPDARYRATEFPNVDSIFATAWLDLAREPQIVVAPNDTKSPFSLEIVDAWSNVVVSFDEKTLAELPTFQIDDRSLRAVAIVGPNSPKPTDLPAEIRVVESPSSIALVLTRVFVKDSTSAGAFGTRPVVQTLYDFATVTKSTFINELKNEKTNAAPDAKAAPIENDANAPETSPQPSSDADVDKPTPEERESKINQDLTPPKTQAFDQLQRLYVAQNVARYADRADDQDVSPDDASEKPTPQNDITDDSTIVKASDQTSAPSNAAQTEAKDDVASPSQETPRVEEVPDATDEKTSVSERADAALQAGERNYKRERAEERGEVEAFWREAKEREHEAARAVGSTYDDVKHWFYNRFEHDKHFWSRFNDALRRDARRDLQHFERLIETPRPTRPWFEDPVERVARMSPERFWSTVVELLKTNPPTDANATIANSLQTLGIEPGKSANFDADLRKLSRGAFTIARKKIELAAQSAIWRNASPTNWIVLPSLGDYGDNYLLRAGAASVAFGVNVEKNVVYPFAFLDASGEPLDGADSYVLRFAPGEEPPTDFLWSLTLYNADGYLIRNERDKYGVRSDEPLQRNADGSLEILIQHDKPQGDMVNWLPAPRGPFVLAMRVYRPNEKATNGAWTPPAIQKVERETADK